MPRRTAQHGTVHAERDEDSLVQILGVGDRRLLLDEVREDLETGARVDPPGTRLGLDPILIEREARCVGKQMTDRTTGRTSRVVEFEGTLFDGDQRRVGHKRLRDRGEGVHPIDVTCGVLHTIGSDHRRRGVVDGPPTELFQTAHACHPTAARPVIDSRVMATTATSVTIHGDVDEGFGGVADAFRKNFTTHGEIGACVAAYRDDKLVVDLWAGHRDRRRKVEWERDTIAPLFSSTKGMAAFTIAAAVSAGLLDYDERVAHYWPEFAANGKDEVTVRQLIDHQAGLSGLDVNLRLDDLLDLDALASILAAQKPAWRPGTKHGYHAITLGFYEGELIRRVDPEHRSLGRYFAEEIAAPLGLDFFIGYPESEGIERVAALSATRGIDVARYERDLPVRIGIDLFRKSGLAYRALSNPNLGAPERAARQKFLAPEIPASNGVGNARALATAYGAAATGRSELPVSAEVLAELGQPGRDGTVPAHDLVLYTDSRYHLGFRKSSPAFAFGSPDHRAYGTTGLGGSFGFADPTTGVGFGYVMNRLGLAILDDVRSRNLRTAVFRALA